MKWDVQCIRRRFAANASILVLFQVDVSAAFAYAAAPKDDPEVDAIKVHCT